MFSGEEFFFINEIALKKDIAVSIERASKSTGINYKYLLAKADQESSFNTKAKSKTSTAEGMYQFTDGTWLYMIKKHGAKYGLNRYADKIMKINGKYFTSSKKEHDEILNLRSNPQIATIMAAEYAKENYMVLENFLKRNPNASELYIAHFMGPTGAMKLFDAINKNPKQKAKNIFPSAAKANKNIFYDWRTKKERSVEEVKEYLSKKFIERFKKFTNLSPTTYFNLVRTIKTTPTYSKLDDYRKNKTF
jgi:hypothetical protein